MVGYKRYRPQSGRASSKFYRTGKYTNRAAPSSSFRRFGPMSGRNAGYYRRAGNYGRYNRPGGGLGSGQELKFHDIDMDLAPADYSLGIIGNTDSVVKIGQGLTESTRIGRKCVIRSIGWRGDIILDGQSVAGVGVGTTPRLMLVQDTQANGAAPAVSGIGGVLESADWRSFNNLSNKGRYKVLWDKRFSLNPSAAAGNGTANDVSGRRQAFQFFKKCAIPLEFSGVANPAAITELRTNNIFCILILNNGSALTQMQSKFRFRFSDA